MAELNDKLITYGNLSTFYDKLQEQGLGGNAIEEVSELPNASENKDKLFRLDNGDKDVYAAKLISSETTTTNRLPDAQQIDKAYLYDTEDDSISYYKGAYHIVLNGNETYGYMWYQEGYIVITSKNAETIVDGDCASAYFNTGTEATINEETRTITIESPGSGLCQETIGFAYILIPAIYNAPESAQIGNAYLNDGDYCYYNGVEYMLNYSDGVSIKAYGWGYEGDTYPIFYTPKKASEIYYQNMYSEQTIVGKYTDAIGYFIDYSEYPIVNNTITLDYPFSDAEDAMGDWQILYIPQLNAPDSEQVDNAYIDIDGERYVYKGEIIGHFLNNTTLTLYQWYNPTMIEYTTTPASNIFGKVYASTEDSLGLYYDSESDMYVSTDYTAEDALSSRFSKIGWFNTVKYQRTETTEVWGWEQVPTKDYVDDAIATVNVKPITNVSVLPDAEANKDSVLRLEGDKKVYLSKYNSNNAPDAQQVGVAYITDDTNEKTYYSGTEVTILASNGTFTGYAWLYEGASTVLKAQDISVEKAEQIFDTSALFYSNNDGGDLFHISGNTYQVMWRDTHQLVPLSTEPISNLDMLGGYYIKPVGYQWKRVVTEDELDGIGDVFQALEARIYALEHPTTTE